MMTVPMQDFLSEEAKYFDLAKTTAIEIDNGEAIYNLTLKTAEEIEYDYPLTPEEEAIVKIAEEQLARGEYVEQRDDETVEQFFERITAE